MCSCSQGPKGTKGVPGLNVFVVDGVLKDCSTIFEVLRYLSWKELCDPTIKPIFVCHIQNKKQKVPINDPSEWVVIVVTGTAAEEDVYYRADPRDTTLLRDWSGGGEFPKFRPVYQIKKLGHNNKWYRYGRTMVREWIKNEFTFLQTTELQAQSAG